MYSLSTAIVLGTSKTGLTITAQLIDIHGADVGELISEGFVETGKGTYLWYHQFENTFIGGAKIYGDGELMTITSINPPSGLQDDSSNSQVNLVSTSVPISEIDEIDELPTAGNGRSQALIPLAALRTNPRIKSNKNKYSNSGKPFENSHNYW